MPTVLTVAAILVLVFFVALMLSGLVAGRRAERPAVPTDPQDPAEGPDHRAGGAGFRRHALEVARGHVRGPGSRRRSARRERSLAGAQAAHVADLTREDPPAGGPPPGA